MTKPTWREQADGILEMVGPNGSVASDFLKEALRQLDELAENLHMVLEHTQSDQDIAVEIATQALATELQCQKEHNALQQTTLHELHARMKTKDAALAKATVALEDIYRTALHGHNIGTDIQRIVKTSSDALARTL